MEIDADYKNRERGRAKVQPYSQWPEARVVAAQYCIS